LLILFFLTNGRDHCIKNKHHKTKAAKPRGLDNEEIRVTQKRKLLKGTLRRALLLPDNKGRVYEGEVAKSAKCY